GRPRGAAPRCDEVDHRRSVTEERRRGRGTYQHGVGLQRHHLVGHVLQGEESHALLLQMAAALFAVTHVPNGDDRQSTASALGGRGHGDLPVCLHAGSDAPAVEDSFRTAFPHHPLEYRGEARRCSSGHEDEKRDTARPIQNALLGEAKKGRVGHGDPERRLRLDERHRDGSTREDLSEARLRHRRYFHANVGCGLQSPSSDQSGPLLPVSSTLESGAAVPRSPSKVPSAAASGASRSRVLCCRPSGSMYVTSGTISDARLSSTRRSASQARFVISPIGSAMKSRFTASSGRRPHMRAAGQFQVFTRRETSRTNTASPIASSTPEWNRASSFSSAVRFSSSLLMVASSALIDCSSSTVVSSSSLVDCSSSLVVSSSSLVDCSSSLVLSSSSLVGSSSSLAVAACSEMRPTSSRRRAWSVTSSAATTTPESRRRSS